MMIEKHETCPNGCGSLEWAYDAQRCFLCGYDGIMGPSSNPRTLSELQDEVLSLGAELADGIDASYDHSCECGRGEEAERGCPHCNSALGARHAFWHQINELFSEFRGRARDA